MEVVALVVEVDKLVLSQQLQVVLVYNSHQSSKFHLILLVLLVLVHPTSGLAAEAAVVPEVMVAANLAMEDMVEDHQV